MTEPPVVALTGQLAAGRSTLARALAARFEHAVHVDVDADGAESVAQTTDRVLALLRTPGSG